VIGTSLTVHPFASLAWRATKDCPRVLINVDRVGDFGHRPNDIILLGKCDDIVTELAKELEWYDELLELWELTALDEGERTETRKPQEIIDHLGQKVEKRGEENTAVQGSDGLAEAEAEVETLASALKQAMEIREDSDRSSSTERKTSTESQSIRPEEAKKPAVGSDDGSTPSLTSESQAVKKDNGLETGSKCGETHDGKL